MNFKSLLDLLKANEKSFVSFKAGTSAKSLIPAKSNVVDATKSTTGDVTVVLVTVAVGPKTETSEKALVVLSKLNETECANLNVVVVSNSTKFNMVSGEPNEDYVFLNCVKV
jgi:hypothetical protein